jgi:hypothetical protein
VFFRKNCPIGIWRQHPIQTDFVTSIQNINCSQRKRKKIGKKQGCVLSPFSLNLGKTQQPALPLHFKTGWGAKKEKAESPRTITGCTQHQGGANGARYLAAALPLEADGCSRKSRRVWLKSLGSSCCGRCPVFGITLTVAFSPSFLHAREEFR